VELIRDSYEREIVMVTEEAYRLVADLVMVAETGGHGRARGSSLRGPTQAFRSIKSPIE
jgi:hypothetical protein